MLVGAVQRAMSRPLSPSSASRLRRSDSLRSVSSGSERSEDSRGSPAATPQGKGKSVSFNKNVRVQYPRRTSHSFSKFDSLTSLNGRNSPVTNGNEIDYSNTNLNGNGIPYASSPYHAPSHTLTLNNRYSQNNLNNNLSTTNQKSNGGKKFWSSVWRSHSTRRPEDKEANHIIKYKVKHTSPLVGRKLGNKKQAGSESPQVKRNHVKKIVSLFNRQAAVEKQKLKEDLETSGPKKGLHDLQTQTMPVPAMTLSRSPITRSSSPPIRPSTSPPDPPTITTNHIKGPTFVKRTVTTTTYEPKPYEHVSFNNPLGYSQATDSSVNTSDKENSSFQSGSSFLNRDSGISLPSSPLRSTSPGPFISTVTLNHSPKGNRNNHQEIRHDFRPIPPFESSDDSMYSDGGPPQRPLRTKAPTNLNIINLPPPPMKDAAVQVRQVKPGNLTPVEEQPSRIYAPLYSQVNKSLKKTQSAPPPPPPPSRWASSSYLIPPPAKWASTSEVRSQSPQWKHYRPGSPIRYGENDRRAVSPLHAQRFSDNNAHSDFTSDNESAASRSRTPISHVKTSSRSFGFNIGTKKKVKSKKSKTAQESDSSSTSSQGVERTQSLLRSASRSQPARPNSRSQHYNSMLDLSPAYNRTPYPTYEDEYGAPPKPPHTYSWSLSLGRTPKSKRSVDGGSTATGPIYSTQAPIAQTPRKAYSDAPSSVDEDHPPYSRRGGLAAAFHHRNVRGDLFNSGASSCGSMTASEAAGVREPIVMYIPGVQRTGRSPEANVNRSNSFFNPGSATLNRQEHKSRFAKQETKTGKNDRYKPKDPKQEKVNQQQIQRSKSIPRNARLL
ncbi:serine/arginine repetitive matrix protein 1-like [Galendromus occidentalis]|uniref:Serine/arginine repetitive matrix protein 1-like n=1 Tax=Galendromus occidentalis TaxID=34638 RepID=A0AAJ7SGZ0_9ACAR|nr:serine/arginine repetitive matrix protein 1-like [Galendromus occidentalis]